MESQMNDFGTCKEYLDTFLGIDKCHDTSVTTYGIGLYMPTSTRVVP